MASSSKLSYIITHVFLPPKLPQEDDSDFENDSSLVDECCAALRSFQAHLEQEHGKWTNPILMVSRMLGLRGPSGHMLPDEVDASLERMKKGDVLAFHIRSQNAGLIVRRTQQQVSFESFELSPTTADVMMAKGRLRRCFPGPAIAVSQERIADPSFRKALVQLLTELDDKTPAEVWPVVIKSGSKANEVRDSVHPKFITEMLTGILRGIGQPVDVARIYKRTRDDVLWSDAYKPWRRSPLWLLVRVALQTSLGTEDKLHSCYKSFMIFLMTQILERALRDSLSSDILFVMAAKINRRVLKLALRDEVPWVLYVHKTIESVHQELAKRWAAVEQNPDPFGTQRAWKSSKLFHYDDTQLTVSTLRPYLAQVATRGTVPSNYHIFTPDCRPRICQEQSTFPKLILLGADDPYLFLADLELWVQDWLDDWLIANLQSSNSCTLLADLIEGYTATATSQYAGSPEDISLMLLTSMDLWIALDKCAIHQHSLLSRYDPGFSQSLFHPFQLPKKVQMERLSRVEQYVTKRINASIYGSLHLFRDVDAKDSFAVRYFEESLHHQILRRDIEAAANIEREQKKLEFEEKRRQYHRILGESDEMSCERIQWNRNRRSNHSPNCTKCRLISSATSMQITVHEWPLPKIEIETKSAVFELDVPTAIAKWRDTTYALLVDIFSPVKFHLQGDSKIYSLSKFSGLRKYASSRTGRLQLASRKKPFVSAHYGTKKISEATEESICVNNGLQYSMYDSKISKFTGKLLGRCDVLRKCTFQLPCGPYQTLQFALDGTTHTTNEIVARQAECPKALNQHEFYAFTALRSGDRLQWRNIARELVARVLNFGHEETYLLVAQTAWQVGRPGDGKLCREAHVDLEEEEFGMSLLSVMGEAVGTVEGNWQNAVAIRTIVALTTRLLSLSSHSSVLHGCCSLLRRARKVALGWTREVGKLLHNSQGREDLKMLNLRALEMALTCHGTFDVDKHYLSELIRSTADIADVTECSIVVHDRCPTETADLPRPLKTQLQRYRRLSHLLEPFLCSQVLADPDGIDRTVGRLWAGYRSGRCWASMRSPNGRWLVNETSSEGGHSTMTVHWNLLDGSLLVNGTPLTRLPRSYESHATYRRLLGERVLDVVPSTMTGMVFETRNELYGQQVHFRMYGSELIIRTRRQTKVCELLPKHALDGDFPQAFVEDYAHWLDMNTTLVEWRPLAEAWAISASNWDMSTDLDGSLFLSRGPQRLIDVRSPTAVAISQVLSPLERLTHTIIILDIGTGSLEVNLPRLKLDFSLGPRQKMLESKQFRGMVVDERQTFGALTGLVNKLVLREVKGPSRTVVVPHGSVSFSTADHHVRVMIDTTLNAQVKYHYYNIDSQLGRLVDNGNLRSRLYRLYLHAITAHCLTDELTGRTGTEEALYGLAGASTRSLTRLDPVDIELLEMLAQLTPRRQYYPKGLQVMQQVKWGSLSPLSQHCEFYRQVASIMDQARSLQFFQEQPTELPTFKFHGEIFLQERAAIRDSSFQVEGFGAETYTADQDMVYSSRDQPSSGRELQTYCTAKLVDEWSTDLASCTELLSEVESWGKALRGSDRKDDFQLNFDLKYLDPLDKFFPDDWLSLCSSLSTSVCKLDKYKIMVFLSTLSFSQHANQRLVQTLLAFATMPELRNLQSPKHSAFQLTEGYRPVREKLVHVTKSYARQFHECPEYSLPNLHDEKLHHADQRRKEKHEVARDDQVEWFVEDLISQWPEAISAPANTRHGTYIKVKEAMERVQPLFHSWHRNDQFKKYMTQIQIILGRLSSKHQALKQYSFSPPIDGYVLKRTYIKSEDLLNNPAPFLPESDQGDFGGWIFRSKMESTDHSMLAELLDRVSSQCSSRHEQRYAADLVMSFKALREDETIELKPPKEFTKLLESNLKRAKLDVKIIYEIVRTHLQLTLHTLAQKAQMLPRLSPTSILSYLAFDKVEGIPFKWKGSLVSYGLSLVALQRAERLVASATNTADLLGEIENPGHQDWDPMLHSEWLLLEVENNISIRQEQAQICNEMVSPSSGLNSVMQLNMGLGKSSVIVPMAAVALADRTKLVRVVILKPLAMQMFYSLTRKLGGLLNRRIFYLPISRSLKFDVALANHIHGLYEECMSTGGILLVQPEHILSFDLMGFEQCLSGNSELGNVLIRTQEWLRENSRDILDESDEILSVRFELVYTIGTQRPIEFGPDRWVIIQSVLGLLGRFAHQVLLRFPHGLDVLPAPPGGFPRIRILQTQAGDELLGLVARHVCETGLPGVPVWNLPQSVREVLIRYLTDPELNATPTQLVQGSAFNLDAIRNGLHLLKGLFAGGVLRFALEQKRWRVNYGLDLSRTMLAVPYHAKDNPAPRAEFSHPDAAIVLTCLSYYYGGLSDQQIHASFEALLQSDCAVEEYARWVKDAPDLPVAFREVSGVNLSNVEQCRRDVFGPLRSAKSIIDFYMANIVFPKEMKEFPNKLSSSGWDIAQEKAHPTTGFSGTNDSRYILPLSIAQCELLPQLPTNAKVLGCLLRPENSFVDIRQVSDTGVLDAESLLQMASSLEHPVRVILDVGAQVLELQNEEMVRKWLFLVPDSTAQAAIFFDRHNELCVLSRDGTVELFLTSPFAKQMDKCIVFLGGANLIGTHLDLPEDSMAIVTLGPGLTKDRLMQACWRLRKLGKGQSVVFCGSVEVQRKILESSGKIGGTIDVADVLKWCIANTGAQARKCIPLWATQGVRHQRRHVVSRNVGGGFLEQRATSMLEVEALSLQQRYGSEGAQREEQILLQNTMEKSLVGREKQLADIRAKCREFDIISFGTAKLQEEQERELSPENERQQQVELPPALLPCKHSVHKDVRRFIADGVLAQSSDAFQPAFGALRNTSAFEFYESTAWPDDLLVTTDFAQTVEASSNGGLDSFLRPVNWIVSYKHGSKIKLVVLSPHEAHELLPYIRRSKNTRLHVYSPRLNVSTRSLEDLSFCSVPAIPKSWSTPRMVKQLNIFAGQLYIRDYEEYVSVCMFLGLCSRPPDDQMKVECDGFISVLSIAMSDCIITRACPFTTSPVAFVRMIMALRRKGQSFKNSHFGKILGGELILKEEF